MRYRRKGKLKKLFVSAIVFLIVFSMFTALAPQVKAQAISSTSDPTDDLYLYQSGSPASTWPVIDIVYAEISQVDAANIKLLIKANQPIPLTNQWQGYIWLLDTGIPAPPYWNPIDSNDINVAYHVGVHWANTGPLVVDVFNVVDGTTIYYEDARDYPEQYFSGDTCSITIPLSWIGNPTSIKWVANTIDGVASPSGRHDKAPNTGHVTLTIESEAEVDDYVCYNHYPYLIFSSQTELDSHVNSVHGGWLEYNFRFAFGLHEWTAFEKVGQLLRDRWIVGDELGEERIPAEPQIGPYEGFVRCSGGDVLVTNSYTDKIVALVGFNQFGDYQQTVWLEPAGSPGDSQWWSWINYWMVELHFSAIDPVLTVPYYGQDGAQWCLPASSSMILKHFGLNIHMWDIADQLDIPNNPLLTIWEMREFIAQFPQLEVSDVVDFWLWDNYVDLKNYMISALDLGSPVLLSLPSINHAVLSVGYYGDLSNPTFYIHDPSPSGELLRKIGLSHDYPHIAVEVTWNQLGIALDGIPVWARAFHVGGIPSPPLGSIDFGNLETMNLYAENPQGRLNRYFDKGISWEQTRNHLPWMDSSDTLHINPDISNHLYVHQSYYLKVSIEVESVVKWVDEQTIQSIHPRSSFPIRKSISLASIWDSTKENVLILELWDEFQNTQFDKIQIALPRSPPILRVVVESPVNILVTAPSGLRVGYESTTGEVVNEIPGATYSGPGTEPQVIIIPSPLPGAYTIDSFGTGIGPYTIIMESVAPDGTVVDSGTWTRTTSPGELHTTSVELSEDGSLVSHLYTALDEIDNLRESVLSLYENGEIDQYKYDRFMSDMTMTEDGIVGAMGYLDTVRQGFDDKVGGLYALKSAVGRLEYLINDLQNWVRRGDMPSDLADEIIQRLESINLAMTYKAKSEAESEKMLAAAAIEDAEARGRHAPWLWNEISYIDQNLADAEYWLEKGWLSKAISYYKTAFWRSQRTTINAWHWSWRIDIKNWIDQIEENMHAGLN